MSDLTSVISFSRDELWQEPGRTLQSAVVAAFRTHGCVVLKGLLTGADLEPARTDIAELIRLQLRQTPLAPRANDPAYDVINRGVQDLAGVDRRRVGAIYDAAMKLLSTRQLALIPPARQLVEALLQSKTLSISNNMLVRIDLPSEDKFLFDHWHQDYPYSMVSRTGCVLWIPLETVTMEMGPVELLLGSHKPGLATYRKDPHRGHLSILDHGQLAEYERFKTPVEAGDVVVFDLMLAHRSSPNRSAAPRWTVTYRYCDMTDATSVAEGWPCYYTQGKHFTVVHPEFYTESDAASV